MQSFPAVDPIPLPAPIWLFKLLHIVTLSLHFVAVEMLLGGLLIATLLSISGNPLSRVAARALARRLTVVMTYVINLGVPPLLFAQVLYGRALYTSSVLIGAYWISIILLLMLVYRMLYRFSSQLEKNKTAWPAGLVAWLLAGFIARLLTTNMTLMLRPETWPGMYSASAAGHLLPSGDPTLTPRWLLMLAGGLFIGGLWLIYLSARSTFAADEKKYLAALGGRVATLFGLVYIAAGLWANGAQPGPVKALVAAPPSGYGFYRYYVLSGYLWLVLVVAAVALAASAGLAKITAQWTAMAAALLAVLVEISFTVYRDAIRDLTLLSKGFNVWDRVVVTNWSVVGLFLILFAASLGVIGWLVSVVARAKKPMEGAAGSAA
jgi:hypothetical protein